MSSPVPSVSLQGLVTANFSDDPFQEFPTPVPAHSETSPLDSEYLRPCYPEDSTDNPSKPLRPASYTAISQPVFVQQSSLTQSQGAIQLTSTPGSTPSASASGTDGRPNGAGPPTDSPGPHVLPCEGYLPAQLMDTRMNLPSYFENATLSHGSFASSYEHSLVHVDRNNPIPCTNAGSESTVIGPLFSANKNRYGGSPTVTPLPRPYLDHKIPVSPEGMYLQDQCHDGGSADGDEVYDSEDEESVSADFALLSSLAVNFRSRVHLGTVKCGVRYPGVFTGKELLSTIRAQLRQGLLINHGISTDHRRAAVQVARSLQSQLFFYEVYLDGIALAYDFEGTYMLRSDAPMEELPTGIVTYLTKCYSPCCADGQPCYAYSCPRRPKSPSLLRTPVIRASSPSARHWAFRLSRRIQGDDGSRSCPQTTGWEEELQPEIFTSLPEQEPKEPDRQTLIHKVITKEQQYIKDLDFIEEVFIRPLQNADPPIVAHKFIEEVFGNILDLRECNRHLLEALRVRQREQGEVISRIGDIFLNAAVEFRLAYSSYIGKIPVAERRLKEEMEKNRELRAFLEQCLRHPGNVNKIDLKHWLNHPSEHLDKYPIILRYILTETAELDPDIDSLKEAIEAMANIQGVAQLRTFQTAMGNGPTGKFEWHNLVPVDVRDGIGKKEILRQAMIFELIRGEMTYVKDLENIEHMYVQPLRSMDPPAIPHERLETFIREVFNNFGELYTHHRLFLDSLFEIQRAEHPVITSVAAPMHDAVLNFRDSYLEYVPNYPIAAYRIDEEMARSPLFRTFVDSCIRHRDAHRLDVKAFIGKPIQRLLHYEQLLQGILRKTPAGHVDLDMIPLALNSIIGLERETEPGVASARRKVERWSYAGSLAFEAGRNIDLDLLDPNRSLIHSGPLRQCQIGLGWNRWTDIFCLLFDHYFIMTKQREEDGVTKYQVYRRPIPLELLTFTHPSTQRSGRLLPFKKETGGQNQDMSSGAAGSTLDAVDDTQGVYLCTINYNGRSGGLYSLFAGSIKERLEWKTKLEEATGWKKFVSNPLFKVQILSADTFFAPAKTGPSWNDLNPTGKVTCSVPFTTPDRRHMVAIGCEKGVWVGPRGDSHAIQPVLDLRMVTQCAMLEEFGIFLVLADKALFAYHINALVPSIPGATSSLQIPKKLSQNRDVEFFTAGSLGGRMSVIYMIKKRSKCVFRVLEPVDEGISEKVEIQHQHLTGSGSGPHSHQSEWFHFSCDFSLPVDSYNLLFVGAKIVIMGKKGFKIMDLSDLEGITIPQKEDPNLKKLAKRFQSCRPIGLFRFNEDKFLLCYDEFGLYVDKNGKPSHKTGTFEWEGRVEKVAWHPPYILLFSSQFIEIHHMETGCLVQIISGSDIQCIWDGQGIHQPQDISQGSSELAFQKSRVHGVMNKEAFQPGKSEVLTQDVFELVLKI